MNEFRRLDWSIQAWRNAVSTHHCTDSARDLSIDLINAYSMTWKLPEHVSLLNLTIFHIVCDGRCIIFHYQSLLVNVCMCDKHRNFGLKIPRPRVTFYNMTAIKILKVRWYDVIRESLYLALCCCVEHRTRFDITGTISNSKSIFYHCT